MRPVPVLVIGGGPVGLTLAGELGWRGVPCLLAERNPGVNRHPRANVVAARSMEHFRRWGIADRVARAGLPLDYPVEIVFSTRLADQEIFRFSFPSYARCEKPDAESLARLPLLAQSPYFKTSIAQSDLEPLLLDFAASHHGNDVRFGCSLAGFVQDADGVTATLRDEASGRLETVRADYLVACDGGRSIVRSTFDIGMTGRPDLGRFVGIYFRSREFARRHRLGRATLYWAMNPQSPGVFIAIDGHDHFTLQRSLRPGEATESIDPRAAIVQAFGADIDTEILSVQPWRAHATVAQRYRVGRVFLAGDAAHLFVPTGGFGMNTGISDAVDLGWKLAGAVQGWGGPALLAAYEIERRPIGVRNTSEAADNYLKMLPVFQQSANTELPGAPGENARAIVASTMAGERKHFAAVGIHLGYRYEDSPVCIPDGTPPPPDLPDEYVPNSRPGARAPHLWLDEGRSTLDLFGRGFVLLHAGAGERAADAASLLAAAGATGLPLELARLPADLAAGLYPRRWTLVRPDGHVAWRGDALPEDGQALLDRVRGVARADAPDPTTVAAH